MESFFWGPLLVCWSKSLRNQEKMLAHQRTFAVCRYGWWRIGCVVEVRWNGVVVDDFTQMLRIWWSLMGLGTGTCLTRTWSLRFGMLELEVFMCLFHGIPNRIRYPSTNRIVWVVCSQVFDLHTVVHTVISCPPLTKTPIKTIPSRNKGFDKALLKGQFVATN